MLGQLLFTLYTTPLSLVMSKFNVKHHLYADNTQIYLGFDSRNFDSITTELANCREVVQALMRNNKLKLNPDKTELIVIVDDKFRSSMKSSFPVRCPGNNMEPDELVKNLCVTWVLTIQCKGMRLIYVTHVNTIPGNYKGSTGT